MTIAQELRVLNQQSGFVELYTLDCSQINGGPTYRFTPNIYEDGSPLVWQGNTYGFLPIELSGTEMAAPGGSSSGGSLPRPTLAVSNVSKVLLSLVVTLDTNDQLLLAKLIRYRTFAKFLDGQPTADPAQYVGPDIFLVSQMEYYSKHQVKFRLRLPQDMPNAMLPARQMLRDSTDGTVVTNPNYTGFPGLALFRTR